MGKKRMAILWALMLALLSVMAGAEGVPTTTLLTESTVYTASEGKTSSAAAAGYLKQMMRGKDASNAVRDFGSRLTGPEKKLYDLVLPEVKKVAAGEREDTVFAFRMKDLIGQTSFTAAELGVTQVIRDGNFDPDALAAFKKKVDLDFKAVNSALLQDCPYELYWYDKGADGAVTVPSHASSDGKTIYWPDDDKHLYTFSLKVAEKYQNGSVYRFNAFYAAAAKKAAANAKDIVSKHSGEGDAAKLKSYLTEICSLTSYNDDAAAGRVPFGDPWQMIWVFDGDPDTKVVCEGYAKAFQFLCDYSAFKGNISAICASGTMNGGTGAGNHMWNLVRMADGKNYLVDVTNCDEGTVGAPDQLFLVPYSSGNADSGYVYKASGKDITYVYSEAFKKVALASELTVSDTTYDDSKATEPAPTTATATPKPAETTPAPATTAPATATPKPAVTTAPPTKLPSSVKDKTGIYAIKNGKATLTKPAQSAAKITIPATIKVQGKSIPVIAIGNKAFANDRKLTQVIVGKNVATIGAGAFQNCAKLTAVKFGQGITAIGASAFRSCAKLTRVDLGKGVATIGDSAFQGCASLTWVDLDKGVTTIGDSAFQGCGKLAVVRGGAAVKTIGKNAFSDDRALKTFPALGRLESIGASAFQKCAALTKFTLGAKVSSIGKLAFSGCTKLKSVTVKTALLTEKKVGANAFQKIAAKPVFDCAKAKVKAYTALFRARGAKDCTVK